MFAGVDKNIRLAFALATLARTKECRSYCSELFSVTLHYEITGKKASHCGQNWPLNCACSVDD